MSRVIVVVGLRPDSAPVVRFAGSMSDARSQKKAMVEAGKVKQSQVEYREEDVTFSKAGAIAFLNQAELLREAHQAPGKPIEKKAAE